MRCPDCSSDRIIILVHSLRALCAECLAQWSPDIAAGRRRVDGADDLAEVLYMDLPPVDTPGLLDPDDPR